MVALLSTGLSNCDTAARSSPEGLVAEAGAVQTAVVGALAAVLVNNLPAAVLLSAGDVADSQALLVGLNVGPNLAVSGSLSAFLWLKAARQVGARTSVLAFSGYGLVLAPAGIGAALLAGAA